jgi:protoporphyrin/coproporphyrin ferrochelatase
MTEKNVVLLVNLGSPQKLEVKSIRKFLGRFLSDRRVVGLPRVLWLPILYGIILPFRAKKLRELYSKIWLSKHNLSPLIHYTQQQSHKLQQLLNLDSIAELNSNTVVDYAFSYTPPDISNKLLQLHNDYTVKKLIIVPLYPQFSSTTCASVFDSVAKFYARRYYIPSIHFINSFASDSCYLEAYTKQIRYHWKFNQLQSNQNYKLVFSFHSLPVNLVMLGDSYHKECILTAQNIAMLLGITEPNYLITFQSKFGRSKWLEPSTNNSLIDLAKSGIDHIDIVCPGFICDCLETLEEINIQNREVFIKHGGMSYNYIPALNESDDLTNLLYKFVLECV